MRRAVPGSGEGGIVLPRPVRRLMVKLDDILDRWRIADLIAITPAMPITVMMMMAEAGIHQGKEPWLSLEWATSIFDRASVVLFISLVVGGHSRNRVDGDYKGRALGHP
jgi:hypothetical protein